MQILLKLRFVVEPTLIMDQARQSLPIEVFDRSVPRAILADVHHPSLSEREFVVKRHELIPNPVHPQRIAFS